MFPLTQVLAQEYLSKTNMREREEIEQELIKSITQGDAYLISGCRESCMFWNLFDHEEFRSIRERGNKVGYVVIAYKETAVCWAKDLTGAVRKLLFEFGENVTNKLTCQTIQP